MHKTKPRWVFLKYQPGGVSNRLKTATKQGEAELGLIQGNISRSNNDK